MRRARRAALLEEIATQVPAVSGQMERGREAVAGVEELSADAAQALDAIVGTTGEAGRHAARHRRDRRRAARARSDGLTGQIERVAAGSARTLQRDRHARAAAPAEAAAGQADLERAIRELGRGRVRPAADRAPLRRGAVT